MAVSVEELYRCYWVLAEATDKNLEQHRNAYQMILNGVKGGPKEKCLAAQFIPKFFRCFPELADAALNTQLDLCEDEDVSIRRQAIKELPQFAAGENLPRVADILTQLLQTDDAAEFNQVNGALLSIFKTDAKGTLGGLFTQILQGEDIVRERAIKFLSSKLKTLPEDIITKEAEDYIFTESKKVLEDVTGEEFVLLMQILSGLKSLKTVSGRQQLVELVADQAFLDQTLDPSDTDSVDRLLQCTRQVLPLFSKNVHSTRFVTHFCCNVLPSLSMLTSPVADLDIQLEVLKLLAEMSPFCGDHDKLESNLMILFGKLLEYMPVPPEGADNGNVAVDKEPKLQFSCVECLLFSFHQLGKKKPDFLIHKVNTEQLKDFKIRLQYFARGLQVYIRQLRADLQGKTGDALKTEENKIKVVALKITNNISVLIKDLFHNPPSYKSSICLSWKPVQKTEATGQKRPSGEEIGAGAEMKTRSALPKRDAQQIYNPPSGKYSATISNFRFEEHGGFHRGRGRGWGFQGNRGRGRTY
ncbi:apoptosis inhibitor 5-like isoform X2 [Scleropages formosus]|uniref:Apoptosis inhibitor 5-like n=1 Tax=Scleropages formosus TaxID=113540 RepID=A0A8C9U655_SCLFO|nr:apoptosis inhibitor 5-like isoform X2 [Scleropages formosus]